MATTYTPNYNLAQPEVGGEVDTWGGLLNTDLLTIDTTMKAISDVANGALPKTGGTMTGALTNTATGGTQLILAPTSGNSTIEMRTGAALLDHVIFGVVAGNRRWGLNLGDSAGEAAPATGSNFAIYRYDNSGTYLSSPLVINRATGNVNVNGLQMNGDGSTVATGTLWSNFGAVSTQQVYRRLGWNNSVGRWAEVLESDASYALYSYDATGGTPTRALSLLQNGRVAFPNWGTVTGRFLVVQGSTGTGPFPTGAASGLDMDSSTARGQVFAYHYGTAGYLPMDYRASSHNFSQGNVYGPDFIATSDARLKTEIEPIRDAMDKLREITGVLYVKGGKHEAGVIAQDVQRAFPVAVHERDDGYLGVSHGQLQGLVIAALNELDKRIAALELL